MIRIINNTNEDTNALMIQYCVEIKYALQYNPECIVFNEGRIEIFGIDCLIVEANGPMNSGAYL